MPITRSKTELSAEERKKLKKLGQIIRAEREKQKLTLYGVEDKGYSFYQHWQAVEKGEKNITFTTLLSICDVLGKTPAELLKDLGSPKA
ncbi:MAG TPA: helix-turn-helix transcriptional regulator [Pseudobdellovibrionaceae bacterium]|jgi:transcriptional regulator with XRE-family HTH domain